MVAEALTLHIGGMAEDGEPILEPSTIGDVAEVPPWRGRRVSGERRSGQDGAAEHPRESQVAAIDQKADEAGMTRSAYMVRAAPGLGTQKKTSRRRVVLK
jgi:hypothetical protein